MISYMKRNTFIIAAATVLLVGTLFTGCKKDPAKDTPEVESITAYNDLAFFQSAFVDTGAVDEFGDPSYVAVCMGEFLYEEEATNLYIGVADLEEALEYWDACLAPDVARTTSADNKYTYTLTDEEGQSQGSVSFTPGKDGSVAQITTSLPGLQYFDKVTFIPNTAWPYNAGEGRNRVGDARVFDVPMIGGVTFVCVRERANGVKPLFVAVTKEKYKLPSEDLRSWLLETKYCPGSAKAKEIYTALHSDWDYFVAVFEDAGAGQLDLDEACWIDNRDRYPLSEFQHGVNLMADSVEHCEDRWDTFWRNPHKRVLLKVDWLDEDALFYVPGESSLGFPSEEAENLFDGQVGTKWCVPSTVKTADSVGKPGIKCWFVEFHTEDFGDPSGYALTNTDSAKKRSYRNPKDWALLGKKNLSDSWTLLDLRTNSALPAEDKKVSNFTFNQAGIPKDLKYYRLEVLNSKGGGSDACMQFSEFKLTY